jgi:hypothetical protein
MATESLASLLVDLKLNTAGLKTSTDKAVKQLSGLEKQTKQIAKSVKTLEMKEVFGAILDGTKALGQFILQGAEAADKMGKLSQAVGVSVETLSGLDYAAGLSGLATEELGSSLGKLNKAMAEASSGGKEQAATFAALGVSVVDSAGQLRSTEAVLGDLADTFAGMQDGAAKTAYAMKVFGKSGADMIPFLNMGKAGIKELVTEAERLGIVMSAKTSKNAEAFNDAVEKIHRAVKGVAIQVAGALAPALTTLIDRFLKSSDSGNMLKGVVQAITVTFKTLISAGILVAAAFEGVGKGIARIASAVASFAQGNFTEALRDTAQAVFLTDLQESFTNAFETIDALWNATADTAEESGNRQTKSVKMVNASLDEQKKKLAEAREMMEAKLKIKFGQVNRQTSARGQAFRDIKPTGGVFGQFSESVNFKRATEGFKSFQDALDRGATAMKNYESYTAEAAQLEKEGQSRMAASARAAADAHRTLAESAENAAKAFEDQAKQRADATDGLINRFTSKLGRLGEVISTAGQGFQAGGVWGAVAAALAELLTGTDAFKELVDEVNGLLTILGDSMAPVLEQARNVIKGLKPMFPVLGQLIETFFKLYNAFSGMSFVGELLAPIVNVVLLILDPIIELMNTLTQLLNTLQVFNIIIAIVSVVFNSVSLAILAIIRGVQGVYNFVLQTVRDIVGFLGINTQWFDDMLTKNAAAMASTEAKMTRIWNDIANPRAGDDPATIELEGLGDVVVDTTNSIEKLGETAEEVTEQLLNVPTGYKVATARFMASLAESSTGALQWGYMAGLDFDARQARKGFTSSGNPFPGGGP